MKPKIVLGCLIFLVIAVTQQASSSVIMADWTLVNQSKQAKLIVSGIVSDIQYVQPDLRTGDIYTDITIAVAKVLKGHSNVDKDTVRFRIEGGQGLDPSSGKLISLSVSAAPVFKQGEEIIVFLRERWWDETWNFYDGLYPLPYRPPYIRTFEQDGEEIKVADFELSFFGQHYGMKLPLDMAYRFIQNAIEAPDEVSRLEERLRITRDLGKEENMQRYKIEKIESPEFLAQLQADLTRIEEQRQRTGEKP